MGDIYLYIEYSVPCVVVVGTKNILHIYGRTLV